jgi:hypothetical protein
MVQRFAINFAINIVSICVFLSASCPLQAQQTTKSETVRRRPTTKLTSRIFEGAALERARRSRAISIIISLVDTSERFRDPAVRVRTQARAAAALWSADQDSARAMFMRAWTNADKLDVEFERVALEARSNALSRGGGSVMVPTASSLRSEVMSLAALQDISLGNFFVTQMEENEKEGFSSVLKKSSGYTFDPTQPTVSIAKRLEIAQQFLIAGEVSRAREFARPALEYVTSPGMIFLCTLRSKDKDGADALYARLLTQSAQDSRADATTVSLLSSYAFTPGLLVTVTRSGRISNQFNDTSQPADISTSLRSAFFQMAGAILLRPAEPLGQDFSSAGRAGTYFMIARLLPLFEQFAPVFVAGLKTQLANLSLDAPETFTSGQESMLRLGLNPDANNSESVSQILQQLTQTSSVDGRNVIYVKAIRAGMASADVTMSEWANSIEDQALKERALAFVDFVLVRAAINKNDVESVSRIIMDRHLSPLQQVWAQIELSKMLRRTESDRARQLIEDADSDAHKIPLGHPDRVYALSAIATVFFSIDRFRSWSVASEVIKAGNAIFSFTGEETKLSARLRTKNVICQADYDEPAFNVGNLFALLATDDPEVALSMADGLTSEGLRAAAHLSIARFILDRHRSSASSAMSK